MAIPTTTDLANYDTVADIINKYEQSQKEIVAAYELLKSAQLRMDTISKYFYVIPHRNYYSVTDNNSRLLSDILGDAKAKTWDYILDKTQVPSFMTPSRLEKFKKSLEDPEKLPEINHDSIRAFVENVLNSAPDMLIEFIKETFDWLHPGMWSAERYKTNDKNKYEIQAKIIKEWMFESNYSGGCRVNYRRENNVRAMENAFSLLDGRGVKKYPGDCLTAINEAMKDGYTTAETEYFTVKAFRNGNGHIKFKRLDLVNKMNQVAGENILKSS